MFTGIVSDLGRVRSVSGTGDKRFEFETAYEAAGIELGASIACSGACLTVVDKGPGWFAATVSDATLSVTTLGGWGEGTPVNFERPLKAADELGGHLVLGHVDAVGEIVEIADAGDGKRVRVAAPAQLMPYVAVKGSIAVDGVSLTVNAVGPNPKENWFEVNLIPHTLAVTTFGVAKPGDAVNLEIDMLARYVARLLGKE